MVQGPPCTVYSSESPAGKDVKNVVQGPPCTVYSSESRRGLDNRPKTPPKSDGPGAGSAPAKQPAPRKTPMEQQKKQAPGLVLGRWPLSEGEMMAFQARLQATRPPGPQQTLQGMAQSQMATSAHKMKMMEPTAHAKKGDETADGAAFSVDATADDATADAAAPGNATDGHASAASTADAADDDAAQSDAAADDDAASAPAGYATAADAAQSGYATGGPPS